MADDRTVEYELGQAWMTLQGKEMAVPMVFAPDGVQPLLGATARDIFELGVGPANQKLVPVTAMLKTEQEHDPTRHSSRNATKRS